MNCRNAQQSRLRIKLKNNDIMSQSQEIETPSFTVSQVQQQIQDTIVPVEEFEQISAVQGLNRILASDIVAGIDVPSFDNSAMDGYAFAECDLRLHTELTIVGRSYAGHPFQNRLQPGQAVQITTGAQMPAYADSVLPQELAIVREESILDIREIKIRRGQHRRMRGEDLAAGKVALTKGTRLGPAELGLLAALGKTDIAVQRPLRVAIFSTGDELGLPGQPLNPGCVYDSNRVTLHAMLTRFGAQVLDLGILKDDPAEIKPAIVNIVPQADVIITSGGVSNGAADFTRQVLQQCGHINFWSVNMRPGRPLAFGQINQGHDNSYVFGLPGNPVAMMAGFYFFVRPALQLLSGAPVSMTPAVKAIANMDMPKKVGRTEFQRGICKINSNGNLHVSLTGEQGSGMLSSMAEANCLIMLSPEQEDIVSGDTVKVLIFEGLL